MAAKDPVGTVTATRGEVYAVNADGAKRLLAVGDEVFAGETIVTANGSTAEITPINGPAIVIAEQQTVQLDGQVVSATTTDATQGAVEPQSAATAATVVQQAAADFNEQLEEEAAAAGLTGGGEAGGHSFVVLARIAESIAGVQYGFPDNPTGDFEGVTGEGLGTPTAGDAVVGVNEDSLSEGNLGGIGDIGTDVLARSTGVLNYSFGPDGPATTNAFRWTGVTLPEGELTSGGDPVTLQISTDGLTLQGVILGTPGTPGEGDFPGTEGTPDVLVFQVVLTNPATGAYEVELYKALDHAGPNEDDLPLIFNFQVTDYTGDTANGTLSLTVDDDTPVLMQSEGEESAQSSDTVTVEDEKMQGLAGRLATDEHDGGVKQMEGTIVDNVSWGADGFGGVTGFAVGEQQFEPGTTVYWDQHGNFLGTNEPVVDEDQGDEYDDYEEGELYRSQVPEGMPEPAAQLVVNADGTYTFTLLDNMLLGQDEQGEQIDLLSAVTVSAQDGDGDAIDVTVNLEVQDDKPLGVTLPDIVIVEDEAMSGGNNERFDVLFSSLGGADSGTIVNNAAWGADGFGGVTGFTVAEQEFEAGSTVYWDQYGNFLGANESSGDEEFQSFNQENNAPQKPEPTVQPAAQLVVNADGSYTFTLLDNMLLGQDDKGEQINLLDTVGITAQDMDGDRVNVNVFLKVQDDVPVLTRESVTATVDEDDIATPWSQGTSPNDGDDDGSTTDGYGNTQPAYVSGTLAGLVAFGADGGTFGFTSDALSKLQSLHLYSKQTALPENGQELTYTTSASGNNVIITAREPDTAGYGDTSNPVFELKLNTQTGEYEFRLFDELIHVAPESGADENFLLRSGAEGSVDAIDFGAIIQAVDGDGDAVKLTGKFEVQVRDDVPVVDVDVDRDASVLHDETPGSQGDDTTSSSVASRFAGVANAGNDPDVSGSVIGYARSGEAIVEVDHGDTETGADAPALAGDYSLVMLNSNSGLQTTEGAPITLSLDSAGRLIGTVGGEGANAGQVAFAVAIDGDDGEVFVAQYLSLKHPNTHDDDESVNLDGKLAIRYSVTDSDGDTVYDQAEIGERISFDDDGPSAERNYNSAPTLELDETNAFSDTANFANNFKAPDFGSDGAGANGGVSYALKLDGSNVASGLYALDPADTTSSYGDGFGQGSQIILNQSGNTITGSANGQDYFTITIDAASGVVSFTQLKNIWHSNTGSHDETQTLTLSSASKLQVVQTVTDGDGDSDTASIDIGKSVFKIDDDGPSVSTNGIETLDDTNLGLANNVMTGTLGHDFGTDGAGRIDFASMHGDTAQVGTETVKYSWNSQTNTLTARVDDGARDGTNLFTVHVNPTSGDYTVTQLDNVLHTPPPITVNTSNYQSLANLVEIKVYAPGSNNGGAVLNINDGAFGITSTADGSDSHARFDEINYLGGSSSERMTFSLKQHEASSATVNFTEFYGSESGVGNERGSYELYLNGNLVQSATQFEANSTGGNYQLVVSRAAGFDEIRFTAKLGSADANGGDSSDYNVGSITFTLTPADATASLTYTVTDADGDQANGALNLVFNDDEPVAVNDSRSVVEDVTPSITGDVRTDGTDDSFGTDGPAGFGAVVWDANTAAKATLSTYGTLTLNSDGTYGYTLSSAAQALNGGQVVQGELGYTITDADGDTSHATLTITITGTNDNPVIAGTVSGIVTEAGNLDDGTVVPGTVTATGTLTATDADAYSTKTWSVQGTPSTTYGTFSVNASGVWTYSLHNADTDTQALKEGQSVTENYTVRVTDDKGGYADQTVSITINGTNDSPVISFAAGNAAGSVKEDTTLSTSGQLSSSDVDANATKTWSIQGSNTSAYGSISVDSTGKWTYTLANASAAVQALAEGETKNEIYTVRVTDDQGAWDDQQVAITITGKADVVVVNSNLILNTNDPVLVPDWAFLTGHSATATSITEITDSDDLRNPDEGEASDLSGTNVKVELGDNDHDDDDDDGDHNGTFSYKANDNSTGNVSVSKDEGSTLDGTSSNDIIVDSTNAGKTLEGNGGNDVLFGNSGGDTLKGGDGNDILVGGTGDDTLTGGTGADTFRWTLGDDGSTSTPARDTIKDFNFATAENGGDVLHLKDLLVGEDSTGSGANLGRYLEFGTEGSGSNTRVILKIDHDGSNLDVENGQYDQVIKFDNFNSLNALRDELGANSTSDADLIAKMLSNGNLKVDG